MPTNDFLPFGTAGGANVLPQSSYAALTARSSGFASGIAQSSHLNKAWRQGSIPAYLIGQYINDLTGADALDDGNTAALLASFKAADRSQRLNYFTPGGTANALTITPDPAFAALADLVGVPLRFVTSAANTGAVTLAVSGLTATAVTWPDATALASGDLPAGALAEVIYDGTAFRLTRTISPAQAVSALARTAPVGGSWSWSQSCSNNALSAIAAGAYTVDGALNLSDTTFAGGALTFGPNTAGLWYVSFSAIVPSATTDLFASVVDLSAGSLGYSTTQTANSAPGTSVSFVKRFSSGQGLSCRVRQVVGFAQTVSGRLSVVRLGA